MKKFSALLVARCKEFYRDTGSMIWNLGFPFLIIFGFYFAFSDRSQDQYKMAVYDPHPTELSRGAEALGLKYVTYVPVTELDAAIEKVKRHQFDLLVAPRETAAESGRYWVNSSSPKGYFLEKLLPKDFVKQAVDGKEARYVDWLIPGILAMNMMFSALFGVGYSIVRYRKNGVLKRFKATPMNAFQFLSAQIVSRVFLIQAIGLIVYIGCNAVVGFQMRGSYLTLFCFFTLGALSMISLSTLVAARIASEELAEGILNVLSWPMLLFSGVWFSLEGTNTTLQRAAQIFPMSHIVDGARSIMLDGATVPMLMPHILVLGGMTVVFLVIGSLFFRWN